MLTSSVYAYGYGGGVSKPHPTSPVPNCAWHSRTKSWRVRIQHGPYKGSYGYYDDQTKAEMIAVLAAEGHLTPGQSRGQRYTEKQERTPVQGPKRPSKRKTFTSGEPTNVDIHNTYRNNTTGVRGVSFNRSLGRFHVRIKLDGKYCSFGVYDTVEEAAEIARQVYAGERPAPPPKTHFGRLAAAPLTEPNKDPHRDKRSRPMTDLALERARAAAQGRIRT